MTDLVACVSNEKGVLKHLERVVDDEEWNRVILIGQKAGNFKRNVEFVSLDLSKTLVELIEHLKEVFKGVNDTEVAVNLMCGSGKEHMAILSALLKSGVGIRFIALTREGVREV